MKNILSYKLFESILDKEEVKQTVEDICLEISDEGIKVDVRVGKGVMIDMKSAVEFKKRDLKDVIDRLESYLLSIGYTSSYDTKIQKSDSWNGNYARNGRPEYTSTWLLSLYYYPKELNEPKLSESTKDDITKINDILLNLKDNGINYHIIDNSKRNLDWKNNPSTKNRLRKRQIPDISITISPYGDWDMDFEMNEEHPLCWSDVSDDIDELVSQMTADGYRVEVNISAAFQYLDDAGKIKDEFVDEPVINEIQISFYKDEVNESISEKPEVISTLEDICVELEDEGFTVEVVDYSNYDDRGELYITYEIDGNQAEYEFYCDMDVQNVIKRIKYYLGDKIIKKYIGDDYIHITFYTK